MKSVEVLGQQLPFCNYVGVERKWAILITNLFVTTKVLSRVSMRERKRERERETDRQREREREGGGEWCMQKK